MHLAPEQQLRLLTAGKEGLWHGIQATVITDNGPQFACQEFAQLALSLEFEYFMSYLCTKVRQQKKQKWTQFPSHQLINWPWQWSWPFFEERAFPEQTDLPEKVQSQCCQVPGLES